MIPEVKRKHGHALRTLTVIWLFFVILLLGTVLDLQWQQYHLKKHNQLQLITNQVASKVSQLIDSSLQTVYSLPIYDKELKDCKNDLLPILKTINFNNPNISAGVISDSHNHILCSTLMPQFTLPPLPTKTPYLYGPVKLAPQRANAFLLQQNLGKYYISIYIVEKVFRDLINESAPDDLFVQLYNLKEHKNTLQVGNFDLLATSKSYEVKESPIQNLASHKIIVRAKLIEPNFDFFKNELLLIFLLLSVCLLLYYKFRKMLDDRYSLHYALSNAIKLNHFQPVYQPIKDHFNDRYCGAEILLRWQTDTNEIIMPDSFIADAEKSGLILPITLQLVKTTFQQCRQFLKRNPNFHLAFNLSAIHFYENDFFQQFYGLCEDYELLPQQIMLELTERELLDQNDSQIISKMHDLRARGFSLAIDDFGTGHASIKYLQHFPFNYLKIDKIFVQAIGTGAINETLNQAIIDMARNLHLHIIAEGVETIEQYESLQQSKVNYMQGWFFSKALSYEQLQRIIEGGSR